MVKSLRPARIGVSVMVRIGYWKIIEFPLTVYVIVSAIILSP